MSYEELQRALTGDKKEMIVTREGKALSLGELMRMSGEALVDTCRVTILGDSVSMNRQDLGILDLKGFESQLTGRYGFQHQWKSTGCCVSPNSPELRTMNALDCLKEVYDSSLAYDRVKGGWVE